MKRAVLVAVAALCTSCGVVQLYDGERRGADEVARISGDLRVSAGAPVSVILRQVNGRTLSAGETTVEVLPGVHELLVDCRIAETQSVTRHIVEADVFAGRRYRLVAETAPGLRGCTAVSLEQTE